MLAKHHSSWCEGKITTSPFTTRYIWFNKEIYSSKAYTEKNITSFPIEAFAALGINWKSSVLIRCNCNRYESLCLSPSIKRDAQNWRIIQKPAVDKQPHWRQQKSLSLNGTKMFIRVQLRSKCSMAQNCHDIHCT